MSRLSLLPLPLALLPLALGLGCASDSGDGGSMPTPNRAPQVTANHGEIKLAFGDGDAVEMTAEASDPDGDMLTFTWSLDGPGSLSATSGALVQWTAGATPGEATVTVTVSDGEATDTDDLTFSVGTLVAGGDLPNGTTWTAANSPYIVRDDLRVPAGTTTVLAAGTRVVFQGDFDQVQTAYRKPEVEVQGTLLAQGEPGGFPSLGVVLSGGRVLGTGIQQHGGLVFTGTGTGTLTYTTIKDGDLAVANQGSGALSMYRCQFSDNVAGYTGTGSRDISEPVTLRACRITSNSGNGVFVSDDHVLVVDSNLENNLGSGVNAIAGNGTTSADVDSCVIRSNEAGNLRIGNTGAPLVFSVNASNVDQQGGGTTMFFTGCSLSFLNSIDITGCYWGVSGSGTTQDVLTTMDGWEGCEPDLDDWVKDVDWRSSPVLGAGI